jgi:hypothetical protein
LSGGSYDYISFKLDDVAANLRNQESDPRRAAFAKLLKLVSTALHDIEWVDSCDYGPGDENAAIDAVFAALGAPPANVVKAMSYDELTVGKSGATNPVMTLESRPSQLHGAVIRFWLVLRYKAWKGERLLDDNFMAYSDADRDIMLAKVGGELRKELLPLIEAEDRMVLQGKKVCAACSVEKDGEIGVVTEHGWMHAECAKGVGQ